MKRNCERGKVNKKVVIIGLGEIGGVFARGFLRSGVTVCPVNRSMDIRQAANDEPDPDLVVLAVAEKDLHESISAIPRIWRSKLVLLQNELLPSDWQKHELFSPTVISVWFEKKKGRDVKVLIPSPVYGQGAELIKTALESIEIPVRIVANEQALEDELVLKNVYILTTNIAGLVCGGNVEFMWNENHVLTREIANEIMDIQSWLIGKTLDRKKLFAGFEEAIEGDLAHQCMGRSANARLARAISIANEAKLDVAKIREIAADLS